MFVCVWGSVGDMCVINQGVRPTVCLQINELATIGLDDDFGKTLQFD